MSSLHQMPLGCWLWPHDATGRLLSLSDLVLMVLASTVNTVCWCHGGLCGWRT